MEKHLRRSFATCATSRAKGGNYFLNVGPTSEGLIPEASVQRLKEMGQWMRTNSEAIYGTGPTPFGAEAGAFSDTEKDKDGNPKFVPIWEWRATTKSGMIYIHIFKWPDGKFTLPAVKSKIMKAYLLADTDRKPLAVSQTDTGVTLTLPVTAPDKIASVVALEIK